MARPLDLLPALLVAAGLAGCGGGGGSSGEAPAPHEPPAAGTTNVLLLLADDLGLDAVAAYGLSADPPATPRLDALAAEGVLFRRAWSQPMCSPTRATIHTGRYAFRTGIGINVKGAGMPDAEVTLPELLDLGTGGAYDHAYFGKWHLEGASPLTSPNDAGWGHFAGTVAHVDTFDYYDWEKVVDGVPQQVTQYATSVVVDDALAWIGGRVDPWVCLVSFHAPHSPFHAPPAALHGVDLSGAPPPETDPVPYYRAMVEALDTEIGRLLDGLDPDVAARTTVLFVSDNGTPSQTIQPPYEPEQAKLSLYQGALAVPLLARGPYVDAPGREVDGLAHTTDLYATVAEIAGVDLAATLPGVPVDGVSLVPYLTTPGQASLRSTVVSERFWPNVPTYGAPPPPPPGPVCQPDAGGGTPGGPALSVCGDALTDDGVAEVLVTGAPGSIAGTLTLSILPPGPDGTLPPGETSTIVTDSAGTYTGELEAVPFETFDLWLQAAFPAPGGGTMVSNAVKAELLPWNAKAIRDARYKLLVRVHGGPDELYDLQLDPFETTDLLAAGPLTPEQEAAYQALRLELSTLLQAP